MSRDRSRIRKSAPATKDRIKKTDISKELIVFSFLHFDSADIVLCPAVFKNGYTQCLMRRLRALSKWTVSDFMFKKDTTIRNHSHEWDETSRPGGFGRLNMELRSEKGWQFCLDNDTDFGRVHGVIVANTFYVIWLDQDHQLYPGKSDES